MVGRAAYGFGRFGGAPNQQVGAPSPGVLTTKYPTRVYRIAIRSARGGRSCIYRKEHAKPASQETPRLDKQSGEAATCRLPCELQAVPGRRTGAPPGVREREMHERHHLAPGRDPQLGRGAAVDGGTAKAGPGTRRCGAAQPVRDSGGAQEGDEATERRLTQVDCETRVTCGSDG